MSSPTPVEIADHARAHLAGTAADLQAERDALAANDPARAVLQPRIDEWAALDPRVVGALEFSRELADGLRRLPTLAVVPIGEDVDADLSPAGSATIQQVRATVGVVLVVEGFDDPGGSKQAAGDGALRRLQTAVRERLVGWTPARRLDPLAVRRSRLLDLRGGRATWQDDFTTTGWASRPRT